MKLQNLEDIAIIGPGLLGGSIGLGLKSSGIAARVTGIGHRTASLDKAMAIGAIDRAGLDVREASSAQLVILATPIGLFEPMLTHLRDVVKPGTVITDVGSTKRSVCTLAGRLLPRGVWFVGSHPMAGSERRGVEFARSDLFANATCIVTPTRSTSVRAVRLIEGLWQAVGMRVVCLSPARHDKILAKISHLPHLTAAALVNLSREGELTISGMGFLDNTRVASGDVTLWHDIIRSNPDHILAATAALRKQLDRLDQAIRSDDSARIKHFLRTAKRKRDWLLQHKIDTDRLEA